MRRAAFKAVLPMSLGAPEPPCPPFFRPRPGSWELGSATGLYNQGGVNGQEGGQETETENQSESTHGLKEKL